MGLQCLLPRQLAQLATNQLWHTWRLRSYVHQSNVYLCWWSCCCCSGCGCPAQVILYTKEDVLERVLQLTDGKGVKVVYDGGAWWVT